MIKKKVFTALIQIVFFFYCYDIFENKKTEFVKRDVMRIQTMYFIED